MKWLKDPVEQLLYMTLVILFLIVGLSGVGIFVRLHENQQAADQANRQTNAINKHLDCVALLLSKPNRGNLRIQDLDNCRIGQ